MNTYDRNSLIGIIALMCTLGGGFIAFAAADSLSMGMEMRIVLGVLLSICFLIAFLFLGKSAKLDEMQDLIKVRAAVFALYQTMALMVVHGTLTMLGLPIPQFHGMVWFGIIGGLWFIDQLVILKKFN